MGDYSCSGELNWHDRNIERASIRTRSSSSESPTESEADVSLFHPTTLDVSYCLSEYSGKRRWFYGLRRITGCSDWNEYEKRVNCREKKSPYTGLTYRTQLCCHACNVMQYKSAVLKGFLIDKADVSIMVHFYLKN